uniref:Eukaryotic translation initiation factor 3 subunit K n=1 Tax=Propithecus coquereli TaxID=379532 RepID=A0A2K6FIG6_PROCO
MAMFEQMRANVGKLLKGIDRYNPENLATLERYVETQAKENAYDLEANLAVLKLYQFNPAFFQTTVTAQILLKALTNLPHTDFTLCKCMIDQAHQEERPIRQILYLGDLLETCHFQAFWVCPASWPPPSNCRHLIKTCSLSLALSSSSLVSAPRPAEGTQEQASAPAGPPPHPFEVMGRECRVESARRRV